MIPHTIQDRFDYYLARLFGEYGSVYLARAVRHRGRVWYYGPPFGWYEVTGAWDDFKVGRM